MKKTVVKDLPMGVLIMVLSNFFLYGVDYVISSPKHLASLCIAVFCSVIYWNVFKYGWKIAFEGIEIDNTKE